MKATRSTCSTRSFSASFRLRSGETVEVNASDPIPLVGAFAEYAQLVQLYGPEYKEYGYSFTDKQPNGKPEFWGKVENNGRSYKQLATANTRYAHQSTSSLPGFTFSRYSENVQKVLGKWARITAAYVYLDGEGNSVGGMALAGTKVQIVDVAPCAGTYWGYDPQARRFVKLHKDDLLLEPLSEQHAPEDEPVLI